MKIEDSEDNVTLEELLAFQKKYNLLLPDNYKELILKYNGGRTDDSEEFETLLSIDKGNISINYVIKIHQEIEQNIPQKHLPIALDWSDNPITINLDTGEIFKFWFDSDDEPEKIANSLEELMGVKNICEI